MSRSTKRTGQSTQRHPLPADVLFVRHLERHVVKKQMRDDCQFCITLMPLGK